ncbi:hypothetical protein [Pseudoteredinibacter isoporae]|uniref:Type IV pili methyl-accepting chemotaxis transducer N-term n=1 Tax=Pseudoteredinibacter isoporae TaxID=570281 RepID=A0A7X0MV20_9GAMM|nr:hypothetical protein [Pseudoteredinibacter isoporae]MBB6521266.1 hypothetical protein [Pseudoteredinibacter isoporae]NHO86824.1 hypothetical protein [Pseudoteredinibacter isoporae]NIB24724.1 hypothetical protein [Pseudoteredinibacter isoporae]
MFNSTLKLSNRLPNALLSLLLAVVCVLPVAKAKAANLETLTAAEDIGILSQSIVKNYFYLGENLNASRSSQKLKEHIQTIDASLATLKSSSVAAKIEDDLMFIEVIWADLKDTLAQEYTRDTGLLVVDMGEVLLEGSENIANALYDNDIQKSGMIDIIEHQRYLIERMAKLYIISIAGFKDFNVVKQTNNTVQTFDEGLAKIESNSYPEQVSKKVERLRKRWDSSRTFYLNVQEGDLPRTIFFNTEMIERLLEDIFDHHK